MAYDKIHKKDYYQLNVKLDYGRDADVIKFMRSCRNKHDTVRDSIRQYLICEACPECHCPNACFVAMFKEAYK